jgi:hypothetical protein
MSDKDESVDPSVRTAAPDQTRAFTSPYEEKTHTPVSTVRPGEDKGSKYAQGMWNHYTLYRCPLPEDRCQFQTVDGDAAVEAHIVGSHPDLWMELATEEAGLDG